ncbi:TPR-like protein, partial [Vararia minispora EC-137]
GVHVSIESARYTNLPDVAQRLSVKFTSDGNSKKPSRLENLGISLWQRFGRLGNPQDIHDAVILARRANELTPNIYPDKAERFNTLGTLLHSRFTELNDLQDLADAISLKRHAVDLTPASDPDLVSQLQNFHTSLWARFELLGDVQDLEESISLERRIVDLTPEDHPDRPDALNSLSVSLQERFDRLSELQNLQDAILLGRRAVGLVPDDHPLKASWLKNLGILLHLRFTQLSDLQDLEDAILMKRRSVELTPKGDPDIASRLSDLGTSLFTRFEARGDLQDLERAILLGRRADDTAPDDGPDKARILAGLAVSLEARFGRNGDVQALEESISLGRRAVALEPEASVLASLAASLETRFERQGDIQDLEEAILIGRRALDVTADGNADKPSWLVKLAALLSSRFERLGNLQDLEEAIRLNRQVVDLLSETHSERPGALSSLAGSLKARFTRLGDVQDLEEALSLGRRAVNLTTDGQPEKAHQLASLGITFQLRFDRLADLQDLEQAVSLGRRAVGQTPDGHPNKPNRLTNLAVSLHARFVRLGELYDVEEAIALARGADNLTPDDHLNKPRQLHFLGTSLWARFKRLNDVRDLDEVIGLERRMVELTPEDHPDKPSALSNLAAALQARYKLLYKDQDIEDALSSQRRALELTTDNHPYKPTMFNNLSTSLHWRFQQRGDLQDLEEAVKLGRRMVDLTDEGHPNRLTGLCNLGLSIQSLLRHSPSQAQFTSAYDCFMNAAQSKIGPPSIRFTAALSSARLCTEFPQYSELNGIGLRAHKSVLDSILPLIWLGQSIPRRFEQLSDMKVGAAITTAASAAIAKGKLTLALEWLEEGRNVVWGQLTRLRDPLDDLRERDPALAQRLRDVSAALENAGQRSAMTGDAPTSDDSYFTMSAYRRNLEDNANEQRALAREYEELLSKARAIDGLQGFLLPKAFSQLVPAAQNAPVAIVNVDQSRSDTLVLCPSGSIVLVPLPKLTAEVAEGMRNSLVTALRGRDVPSAAPQTQHASRGAVNSQNGDELAVILEVLWRCVVQPVLSSLEDEVTAPGELPHITWCTTGPLSSLPLHAAGIYGVKGTTATKTFNVVVSSYTPSLSALLGRNEQLATDDAPSILVVSQPKTPGQSDLPFTVPEARRVLEHFPSSTTCLEGAEATVEAVFDAMPRHDWVHLACHGLQDHHTPTGSAFFLHDGPLVLARLMGMSRSRTIPSRSRPNPSHPCSHAGRGGLAVLSACQTARGSDALPEEAVHLAAGMLAAGYGAVVGTLWAIADADGPVLVDALYAEMKRRLVNVRKERLRVAYALHVAVTTLRESVGEKEFARWVPFVHFGL